MGIDREGNNGADRKPINPFSGADGSEGSTLALMKPLTDVTGRVALVGKAIRL